MGSWMPRMIILGLLLLVVGVPFLMRGPGGSATEVPSTTADGKPVPKLIIMSPHNEQIRFELTQGFNRHRQAQGKPPIYIDWRSSGGTSDQRRTLLDLFTNVAADGRIDQGIGYDLFFGGGEYEHNKMATGVTVTRNVDGQDEQVTLSCAMPVQIDEQTLKQVFPTPTVGGEKLYHPDQLWVGTALSSFGIIYNRDVLEMLGIDEPGTWSDMVRPEQGDLIGWIGLADPKHSGSIAATYEVIIRRLGWTEGWRVLRRVFANARYFTSSSAKVPVDVSSGEAAMGMCIDFYGRYQVGAIGDDRVGYVDPAYMTAITADPITILRGAPSMQPDAPEPGLANEFVLWVLSKDAQGLWQRRVGEPGGPLQYELRRLPIRRDMYTPDETEHWRDRHVRPFDIAKPFPDPMPGFFSAVRQLAHTLAIDIHEDVVAAWTAIVNETDSQKRQQMIDLFDQMPEELTLTWPDPSLADPASDDYWRQVVEQPDHPMYRQVADTLAAFKQQLRDALGGDEQQKLKNRLRWTLFFQENYRRVIEMSSDSAAVAQAETSP